MSPSNNGEVLVLDNDGKYLLPTNPASARKLLREGKARIIYKDPFTIELSKTVDTPNTTRRLNNMLRTNFFEYFKEPRPVYVQNISNPIGVISLEFKLQNGELLSYKIPAKRDPVALTNFIPFDTIKTSGGFLSFLQPTGSGPARVQLLTEEEYWQYYEKKQRDLGEKSAQKVAQEAQLAASSFNSAVKTKTPIVSLEEAMPSMEELSKVMEPEVNPKIIATCQQLDPENSNGTSPKEAIDIFNSLDLTSIDCDYIMGHTYDHIKKENSLVRKWANRRQQELANVVNEIIESKTFEKVDEQVEIKEESKRGRKAKV